MDATRDFLENLQGLALFMHFKKHRAVSLRDLIYMNPAKRKQIEESSGCVTMMSLRNTQKEAKLL
jgi:RecB family endonuclease NucS